jgi:hypothetical protein
MLINIFNKKIKKKLKFYSSSLPHIYFAFKKSKMPFPKKNFKEHLNIFNKIKQKKKQIQFTLYSFCLKKYSEPFYKKNENRMLDKYFNKKKVNFLTKTYLLNLLF